MPEFNLIPPSLDMDNNDIVNVLEQQRKMLSWLLNHLDHANVKQLYTEYCNIQSEDGETVIDGPLLTMRAADSTTKRLEMGYDPTAGNFVFKLWNSAGSTMIELDSSGNAVFMGTLRTGSTTGQRIEIKDNNFLMYNSSNQLEGLVFGSTFGTWGDAHFFDDGQKIASFENGVFIMSFIPASTNLRVGIGSAGSYTHIGGYLYHTGNKIGFFNTTPVTKTSLTTDATVGQLITVLKSYGLV